MVWRRYIPWTASGAIVCSLFGCSWLVAHARNEETGELSSAAQAAKVAQAAAAGAGSTAATLGAVTGNPALAAGGVVSVAYADMLSARIAALEADKKATNLDWLLAIFGAQAAAGAVPEMLKRRRGQSSNNTDSPSSN